MSFVIAFFIGVHCFICGYLFKCASLEDEAGKYGIVNIGGMKFGRIYPRLKLKTEEGNE